jgi:hypothetical protein
MLSGILGSENNLESHHKKKLLKKGSSHILQRISFFIKNSVLYLDLPNLQKCYPKQNEPPWKAVNDSQI